MPRWGQLGVWGGYFWGVGVWHLPPWVLCFGATLFVVGGGRICTYAPRFLRSLLTRWFTALVPAVGLEPTTCAF